MSKEIDILVGSNLRRLRKQREWGQEELGKKLQTVKQKISAYENGRVGIGKDVLKRLCKLFNVDPVEFFMNDETAAKLKMADDIIRFGTTIAQTSTHQCHSKEKAHSRHNIRKKHNKKIFTKRELSELDSIFNKINENIEIDLAQ